MVKALVKYFTRILIPSVSNEQSSIFTSRLLHSRANMLPRKCSYCSTKRCHSRGVLEPITRLMLTLGMQIWASGWRSGILKTCSEQLDQTQRSCCLVLRCYTSGKQYPATTRLVDAACEKSASIVNLDSSIYVRSANCAQLLANKLEIARSPAQFKHDQRLLKNSTRRRPDFVEAPNTEERQGSICADS